jgi:hypothetical protein
MTNPAPSLDDLAQAMSTPELSVHDHDALMSLSPDEFGDVLGKHLAIMAECEREIERQCERWAEAHPDQVADFAACPSEAADRMIAFYTDDSEPANGEGR